MFSDFEGMYKLGEPFNKTPQHNRTCQTNLPLTMAPVQKKRAFDPEMSDRMDSIKRKKISLEGPAKPHVFCTGASPSVTAKEDKGEGRIGCDNPPVAFRHDITNCTGIDDTEEYLKLKNGQKHCEVLQIFYTVS